MQQLSALVIQISGLALVWTAADMLLPSGRARDSARFVMGLLVMLALIGPVASLVQTFPAKVAALESFRMEEAHVQAQAEAFAGDEPYIRAVIGRYERGICDLVAAKAREAGYVSPLVEARVDDRGFIESVSVHEEAMPVSSGASRSLDELRDNIAALLGVTPEIITLR